MYVNSVWSYSDRRFGFFRPPVWSYSDRRFGSPPPNSHPKRLRRASITFFLTSLLTFFLTFFNRERYMCVYIQAPFLLRRYERRDGSHRHLSCLRSPAGPKTQLNSTEEGIASGEQLPDRIAGHSDGPRLACEAIPGI